MNACVVAEYYPRERDPVLGIWAHEQARATVAAGASVRVLALDRPLPPLASLRNPLSLPKSLRGLARQPRGETRDGIDVELVRFFAPPRGRSYTDWDRWARPRLEQALDRLDAEWGIDVVHAHYALPAGAAALPWSRSHGKPLVVSVHGGDVHGPLLQSPAARAKVGGILRAADAVLCNSADTLRRAGALAGTDDHMRVLHLGARAPADPPPRRGAFSVATLGHVVARKRHEDVMRALANERLADARWIVIGDGPERSRLEGLADELGVAERVEWLGQVEHDAALRELSRCHVMALPSVDEAFGVAYVEAMACGVPAIGCRGEGGPEEIAALGGGMLLVPPRDPAALAEALADREELERLGSVACETAQAHFGWDECGKATVNAYRDTLSC